MPTIFTISF